MRFPKDIYTEPDPDTLANLGPPSPMAGMWIGTAGKDIEPLPPPRPNILVRPAAPTPKPRAQTI